MRTPRAETSHAAIATVLMPMTALAQSGKLPTEGTIVTAPLPMLIAYVVGAVAGPLLLGSALEQHGLSPMATVPNAVGPAPPPADCAELGLDSGTRLVLAVSLTLLATGASAQTYPTREMRMVVGLPAGSGGQRC